MFNLGSNQPTSSRMKVRGDGVGRSMSAIGIGTSSVGGQLFGVSVLTMGSTEVQDVVDPAPNGSPIALNASGLFV